jgi:hypothetical protein
MTLLAVCALATVSSARGQSAFSTTPAPSPFVTNQPPGATLNGTIMPADPNWDPYSDPNLQQAPLLPQGGYIEGQPNATGQDFVCGQEGPFGQRVFQQFKMEYTWLPGNGANNLNMQDAEVQATAAIPFSYAMAPILLTPGFAFHFWSGPDGGYQAAPFIPDLPSRVYDAYLDIGWRPQVSPRLSFDIGVRPGVYSDFGAWDSNAFRIQARGLGIFAMSPQVQIVAGVVYIDRYFIKLLPAGGVIWTPNEDTRFEILFPRPKLAERLTTIGNTDIWVYLAGEFGGGSWSIATQAGRQGVEYDDYRAILGVEWTTFAGFRGYLEGGYVFGRKLRFKSTYPEFSGLDDTGMIRLGLIF